MFSAFVTPATPRTPAGGRACGTPSPTGGLVFRPRFIRRCARICAVFAAYVRKFYWKLLIKKLPWLVLPAPSGPREKKQAQTTAPEPEPGSGRGMSVGARGVLQTALMGLITALRQRNRPKWTSRAVSRGGFFAWAGLCLIHHHRYNIIQRNCQKAQETSEATYRELLGRLVSVSVARCDKVGGKSIQYGTMNVAPPPVTATYM